MPNIQFYLPIVEESTSVMYESLTLPNYVNYDSTEREALLINYWGGLNQVQYFPIGFRSLEMMFAKSFDQQTVALHVTHFTEKIKVEAEWMPVKVRMMGGVQIYDFALDISDEQHYYFILKKFYYDNQVLPNVGTFQTKGMKHSNGNVIAATMGKYPNDKCCLVMNAANLELLNGDDGTGGNGYIPGTKIPTPTG